MIKYARMRRTWTFWGRELRALAEAGELYPNASKRLLTLTRDALPASVPTGISAQTVYEWMLREAD